MTLTSDILKVLQLRQNKVPGQLIIQMTDHCNALCPQCGMRKTAQFKRSKLDVDDIKRIIDKAAANGVEALSFTGGEPMLFFKELIELIHYAAAAGIQYIRTGTNGYLLRYGQDEDQFYTRVQRIVEQLAAAPVRNFWISIDSADPETHEKMRGFTGLIKGIEKAVPLFHEAGLYPSANLGINRGLGGQRTEDLFQPEGAQDEDYLQTFYEEFQQGFSRFYQFVTDLGFSIVNMCYPMSVENNQQDLYSVYTATSLDKIVKFSRAEKVQLFQSLLDTIPSYRSQIRVFTPLSSVYTLKKQYATDEPTGYPCRGGVDFFFIDSQDGQTYPCGFRGNESFGDYAELDLQSINRQAHCTKCDWECFRDPSAMFGPVLEGLTEPIQLFRRRSKEKEFFTHWQRDLAYYEACDLFDGRKPAQYSRLEKF